MTHTRGMRDATRRPAHRRALVLAVAATAVAASACSVPSGGEAGTDGAGRGALEQDGSDPGGTGPVTSHAVELDGLVRTWSVYSPATARVPDAPVLLVIHGTGDTAAGIRSGIGPEVEQLADAHGFSVAYVDGYENNWNECRVEGDWPAKERELDDVGLMRQVVGALGSTGPVYAVGFSSGGHMAMRLALEAPELVDGVGVVAANPPAPDNQSCDDAGEPVPIMFVQGGADTINPVDGGEVRVGSGRFASSRGEVVSAVEGARWFAERNGATARPAPPVRRDGDVQTATWDGVDPVRLVVLDRAGHTFPTLSGRWGRDDGARYDAPGEIWRFLSGA